MPKANPLTRGIKNQKAASDQKIALVETPKSVKKSREGRVLVGGHFAPEVQAQLKIIAAENRTTLQALLAESINTCFAKYGKPEIAELTTRNDALVN